MDIVPGAERIGLLPVGRLDRNSAGILLMTNDKGFIHKLTHPSQRVSKFYRIVVEGRPTRYFYMFKISMMISYIKCLSVVSHFMSHFMSHFVSYASVHIDQNFRNWRMAFI